MRKILFLMTFYFSIVSSIAQVRLEGKLISKKSHYKLSKGILLKIRETNEFSITDSTANFIFKNLEKNKSYTIECQSFECPDFKFDFETGNDNILSKTFEVSIHCDFDGETAKIDWINNEAKLYLIGSIAPIANSKADKKFEKKYKIKYYDFGCTPPPAQCLIEYNMEILKILEKQYGSDWKTKIRKDVVVD